MVLVVSRSLWDDLRKAGPLVFLEFSKAVSYEENPVK